MRVVLASERSQVQNLLMDVVEEEPGTIVVGQAENATKMLVLVKNLRPDVAIIDSNLPYSVGMDNVALSRMSGLDIAQTISEKIPNTRVVVVTNLNSPGLLEYDPSLATAPSFSRMKTGDNRSFKLQELCREVTPSNGLVFANVEVEPSVTPVQTGGTITEKAIFFGVLGVLGGGYLTITMILAPIGIPIVLAGVVVTSIGLLGKLNAALRRKVSFGGSRAKKD